MILSKNPLGNAIPPLSFWTFLGLPRHEMNGLRVGKLLGCRACGSGYVPKRSGSAAYSHF